MDEQSGETEKEEVVGERRLLSYLQYAMSGCENVAC